MASADRTQLDMLGQAGCSKIYREVAARSDRPQLHSLLKTLEPGDVVVVTRLDRLARSTIDLLTVIKAIADKGCLFTSLADQWCDTTTPAGRLMLTVLGGLAEFERELIKARTSEGRARAIRAGVRMGRKPKLSTHAAERLVVNQSDSWPVPTVLVQIQSPESDSSQVTSTAPNRASP